MDDLISRQAATQTALEFIVEYLGGAFDEDFQRKLIERMNALPPARPEIIRCKDCKHRDPEDKKCDCGMQWCAFPKRDDDFCSYAERWEE